MGSEMCIRDRLSTVTVVQRILLVRRQALAVPSAPPAAAADGDPAPPQV